MQVRHGIFFQSLALRDIAAEAVGHPDYRWSPIGETCIMNDSIFAAKDRRAKARIRFADGHACYGFFDQTGAVAYYMWITVTHNTPKAVPWELNTQLFLKPRAGYFWDCFTAPEHRRRGLYRAGLNIARALTQKDGAEKNYICCMKQNTPSLDAIRSSGFYDIFEFTVRRVGLLVFCKRAGGCVLVKFGVPKFDILGE